MVLKAGQRSKGTLQIAAMGIMHEPMRFLVARAFADALKIGDFVRFTPKGVTNSDPGWSKTWRVIRIAGDVDVEDIRQIHVIEVL